MSSRDDAESRADTYHTAAINGHKLAAAVKATRTGRAPVTRERLAAEPDPLLAMANRLFPD